MGNFRIYVNCLSCLFSFMTLDLFICTFSKSIKKNRLIPLRATFLFIYFIYAFIPHIPYSLAVFTIIDCSYTLLLVKGRLTKRIVFFIKYELYYIIGTTITAFLHVIFSLNFFSVIVDTAYQGYSNILANFILYLVLVMYVISRQLMAFPSGKIYRRYFLLTIGIIVTLLILCSMMLDSDIIDLDNLVFIIFSLLLVVTILCLSIYRKLLLILEENTIKKIEAEKNALQQDYYVNIEKNLKSMSILRHDFKNHLLIMQDYAEHNKITELQNYIRSICDGLTPNTLIETASPVISSIINAKSEECKNKNIAFHYEQNFSFVKISDFDIVTLLSNLLDNAILAASKCESGYIDLKIFDVNSSYLEIDCTNNHVEQIRKKHDRFLTTKNADKENHGLGIQSMRRTVEKLHGEMNIEYTNETFHVNILITNH